MFVRAHQVFHLGFHGVQRLLDLFPRLPSKRLGLGILDGTVEDQRVVCRRGKVWRFRGFALHGGLGRVSFGFSRMMSRTYLSVL
jgi:hypothetical protein